MNIWPTNIYVQGKSTTLSGLQDEKRQDVENKHSVYYLSWTFLSLLLGLIKSFYLYLPPFICSQVSEPTGPGEKPRSPSQSHSPAPLWVPWDVQRDICSQKEIERIDLLWGLLPVAHAGKPPKVVVQEGFYSDTWTTLTLGAEDQQLYSELSPNDGASRSNSKDWFTLPENIGSVISGMYVSGVLQPLPQSTGDTCHAGVNLSMMAPLVPPLPHWISATWDIQSSVLHRGFSSWCTPGSQLFHPV